MKLHGIVKFLVDQKFFTTEDLAREAIRAGKVFINGEKITEQALLLSAHRYKVGLLKEGLKIPENREVILR